MALLTAIRQFMGRPKKVIPVEEKNMVVIEDSIVMSVIEPITLLSIDYHNEGLNNIARKINELIERLNA